MPRLNHNTLTRQSPSPVQLDNIDQKSDTSDKEIEDVEVRGHE